MSYTTSLESEQWCAIMAELCALLTLLITDAYEANRPKNQIKESVH